MKRSDPIYADQSKYTDEQGNLRYSADKSLVFPGATGVRSSPQFEVGDRCFSHYTRNRAAGISGWGTIERIGNTDRERTHGVTGSPLPDTTWYWITTDEGGSELLDDAHGDWELARILTPAVAKECGYGDDPKETA